jgi:hypothetical protein
MVTKKHVLQSLIAAPQSPHARLAIAFASEEATHLRDATNDLLL